MPRLHRLLIPATLAALFLSSCAPSSPPLDATGNPTIPPTPPEDFWIGITILGPVRSGGESGLTAYDALPRPLRPGRYIVEADRGLRVGMGAGAKQSYFPPQTRQLTASEMAELWRLANAAGFLNPNHPNFASGNGEIDPDTIKDKTVYVINTHANGIQEMVAMEVDLACAEPCERAKAVVDWLAEKAWLQPAPTGQ